MAFSINTNLSALQVYNSLAKINSQTQNAQLRLATMKRINSVADDTSGFNVGTTLKRQTLTEQAEINNGSSSMNYLSTAESSLQQLVDKLNKITEKYTESHDPLKLKSAIAKDINALADEIDSILKTTNIGGRNILANSDGTALASNPVFKVGGDLIVDFASDDYLNVGDLDAILNGGTVPDPGVTVISGTEFPFHDLLAGPSQVNSTLTINYDDGSSESTAFSFDWDGNDVHMAQIEFEMETQLDITGSEIWHRHGSGDTTYIEITALNGKKITDVSTTPDGGIDVADFFGIKREASAATITSGLRAADPDAVLTAASNITAVTNNVKATLGRIGNLSQIVDSRTEFLTTSIANNNSAISKLFDADMAQEQLNATKGSLSGQIGTSMLAQTNISPQHLLSLFR